ncbi:hypothetical protein BJV82DRAFT_227271 [Fennellomyces sp. T-0311]|nr:hypothetical protein BJV82DRAFT_227271 [Fennellomyces sp. T-0311]
MVSFHRHRSDHWRPLEKTPSHPFPLPNTTTSSAITSSCRNNSPVALTDSTSSPRFGTMTLSLPLCTVTLVRAPISRNVSVTATMAQVATILGCVDWSNLKVTSAIALSSSASVSSPVDCDCVRIVIAFHHIIGRCCTGTSSVSHVNAI